MVVGHSLAIKALVCNRISGGVVKKYWCTGQDHSNVG